MLGSNFEPQSKMDLKLVPSLTLGNALLEINRSYFKTYISLRVDEERLQLNQILILGRHFLDIEEINTVELLLSCSCQKKQSEVQGFY